MSTERTRAVFVAAILAILVVAYVTVSVLASRATAVPVSYVVDGDTIRLGSGEYVRLIGVDTPERGQCGYAAATRALDRMLDDDVELRNPAAVEDRDFYDRLLRYVTNDRGRDAGLALIRRGLADARYDGLDGYGRHPLQDRYRATDAANPDRCN